MTALAMTNAFVMLFFSAALALVTLLFPDSADPLGRASILLGALGGFVALASRRARPGGLTRHQTFLLTASVWLTGALAGALPLYLWNLSAADAIFESMSGLTTTGATVMSGLDQTPRGILMWRAALQAFGGLGFVVTGMALLPILRSGGMQLFRTESSDKGEKELATAAHFAMMTLTVYLVLIVVCAVTYRIGGMSIFDATTHALTTLSTGGFSNYDASFGHFQSPFLQWAGTIFMLLGGLPFVWYFKAVWRGQWRSEQVILLVRTLVVVIVALTVWLVWTSERGFFEALTAVAFNVISVVTTTGYATEDFTLWGPFAIAAFVTLTAMGGCTGSTAGGAKMMRWIILWRAIRASILRIGSPHGIFPIRYEGRTVSDDVMLGVISFFTFYLLTVGILATLLEMLGLDFMTAFTGALTAVANVGPGAGDIIGPAGNFAPLGAEEKLVLTFGMYAGRLEMMTVYVLFSAAFWREV